MTGAVRLSSAVTRKGVSAGAGDRCPGPRCDAGDEGQREGARTLFLATESVTVGAINLHAKRQKLRPVFNTLVRPAAVPDGGTRRRPARIPAGLFSQRS